MRKEEERAFRFSKNELDNEYQKTLTFLEITIVTIASTAVTLAIYFYSIRNTSSLINIISWSIIVVAISIAYFKHKLKEINKQVSELISKR